LEQKSVAYISVLSWKVSSPADKLSFTVIRKNKNSIVSLRKKSEVLMGLWFAIAAIPVFPFWLICRFGFPNSILTAIYCQETTLTVPK